MDIFKKCKEYRSAKDAMEKGIYPYFLPLAENEGTEVVFNGNRLIMCGSNNYLGLTTHPVRIQQLPWIDNPSQGKRSSYQSH